MTSKRARCSENALDGDEVEKGRAAALDFFQAAINSTSESIVIADVSEAECPLIFVNKTFVSTTGYTEEESLGRNCRFLQGPETNLATVKRISDSVKKREPLKVEILNYKKDGTPFWNELTLKPFVFGERDYYVGVQSDITERKRRYEWAELMEKAADACQESILITDLRKPDNPIVFANKGFERMTGYTKSEVIGQNCRLLQGEGTDRNTVRKVRQAIDERKPFAVELLNYRKSGEAFWNQFSLTPVADENGEITHYMAVQFEHPTIINHRSFFKDPLEMFNS